MIANGQHGHVLREIPFPDYCYVDTALGNVNRRNRVQHIDRLEIPAGTTDAYTTMFRFRGDYHELCETTGSVKGAQNLSCWSDFLWFDIDSEHLLEALANTRQLVINIELIEPTLRELLIIFFSGAKGFHVGIPTQLFGLGPSAELSQILKRLAREIAGDVEIDLSIYDKNRLWRVPNTRNSKSGLFKIPLTFDELAMRAVDEIQAMAVRPAGQPAIYLSNGLMLTQNAKLAALACLEPPDQSAANKIASAPNGPAWMSRALAVLHKGNRNTTFAKIAGRLHQSGLEPDDILALLEPHALKARFPIDELQREIKGICGRYPVTNSFPFPALYRGETETNSGELHAIQLDELMAEGDAEINWRVDRLLPQEGVGILAGPAGHGKSWMLLDLAIECAHGGKWLGHFPTTAGRVLYIDEESPRALIRHRLKKLLTAKGLGEQQLDLLFLIGRGICLNVPDSVGQLKRLLELHRPELVIVDSLIRVHRAEENSATEMSRVFAVVKDFVRAYGCSILFADHLRKPGHFGVSADQRLRGSTEKAAFVDTLLSLQRKEDRIIVEHAKSRFAEPVSAFVVTIKDPRPGSTDVAYGGDAEEVKQAERLEAAFDFLNEHLRSDEWVSRRQLIEQCKDADVSKKLVDEALSVLQDEERVDREDRKPENGPGGRAAFFRLRSKDQ